MQLSCRKVCTVSKGLANFYFFRTVEWIKLLLITLKLLLFICYWRSVGTLCFMVPSTLDFHGKRANAFIFPIFKAFLDIEAGRNCLFFSYEYLIWHGMLWLGLLCIRSIPPKRYKRDLLIIGILFKRETSAFPSSCSACRLCLLIVPVEAGINMIKYEIN